MGAFACRGAARGWRWTVALSVALALLLVPAVALGARPTGRTISVVRPHYLLLGQPESVWAGRSVALIASAAPGAYESAEVLSDTGQRTMLNSNDGCDAALPSLDNPLDLPWVMFVCPSGSQVELVSPATGAHRTITLPPSPCTGIPFCDITDVPAAVGTQWLELSRVNCPGDEHCSSEQVFQSLSDGHLAPDPSGGTRMLSLDSAALTTATCPPVTVPSYGQLFGPAQPGWLLVYGQFALALGTNGEFTPNAYLERCGTRLHRLLVQGPYPGLLPVVAADSRVVAWDSGARTRLAALALPSERRFDIVLPPGVIAGQCEEAGSTHCIAQLALTEGRLYVRTVSGELWSAPTPVPRPIRPARRAR